MPNLKHYYELMSKENNTNSLDIFLSGMYLNSWSNLSPKELELKGLTEQDKKTIQKILEIDLPVKPRYVDFYLCNLMSEAYLELYIKDIWKLALYRTGNDLSKAVEEFDEAVMLDVSADVGAVNGLREYFGLDPYTLDDYDATYLFDAARQHIGPYMM